MTKLYSSVVLTALLGAGLLAAQQAHAGWNSDGVVFVSEQPYVGLTEVGSGVANGHYGAFNAYAEAYADYEGTEEDEGRAVEGGTYRELFYYDGPTTPSSDLEIVVSAAAEATLSVDPAPDLFTDDTENCNFISGASVSQGNTFLAFAALEWGASGTDSDGVTATHRPATVNTSTNSAYIELTAAGSVDIWGPQAWLVPYYQYDFGTGTATSYASIDGIVQ